MSDALIIVSIVSMILLHIVAGQILSYLRYSYLLTVQQSIFLAMVVLYCISTYWMIVALTGLLSKL